MIEKLYLNRRYLIVDGDGSDDSKRAIEICQGLYGLMVLPIFVKGDHSRLPRLVTRDQTLVGFLEIEKYISKYRKRLQKKIAG